MTITPDTHTDPNAFRRMMRDARGQQPPQAPLGSWLMANSPLVAEAMGHAGFAWAVVDMEHSPIDLGSLVHLLQAVAGTPMVPVTRVPWNDMVMIKRVLDAGATTLMVPFVQNADEAQAAVAATRYPPDGVRGMAGMSRGSRLGTAPNYLTTANAGISVIIQLETPSAIADTARVAALPGVDGIFLGPADISATMGLVGQLQHPDVLALMAESIAHAHAAGKWVGTVGGMPAQVRQYRDMGFDFVAIASDMGLLMRAATGAVAELGAGSAQAASPAAAAVAKSGY